MIAQICSGVKVAGVPRRGASAIRAAIDVAAGTDSQRARQRRTTFGQTPTWRAVA